MTSAPGSRSLRPSVVRPVQRRSPLRVGLVAALGLLIAVVPPSAGEAAPPQDVAALAERMPLDPLEGPDGERLPFEDHAAMREFLRRAEIVDREELSIGSTRPERITLRRDGITARAIFRHVDEQRDRIRLAEGPTYMRFYDSALSEVAAYELGLLLGIDNIPPAVVRSVDGRPGTVQVWIEEAFTDSDRIAEERRPGNYRRWVRQRADMKVFDALVYNADRNTGNVLYDSHWHLWMIDHTRTFQRPTQPVDLSDIDRISARLWERIREVGPEDVRPVLDPYLEEMQVDAVLDRRETIIEHFRSLIRERGAGAVILAGE